MDLRKRKLNPITTVPKKRKIVKTKEGTGQKNTLKKTFTKVKSDIPIESDDGPFIYKIKGVEEIPNNLETVNNSANEITRSTTICSQIPDFTEKDIDDLLNGNVLNFFNENDNLDDVIDTFASSSTADFQISSTPDVIHKSENATRGRKLDLDAPLDLTTAKDHSQNSTQMPANSKPSNNKSTQVDACLNMTPLQSGMPLAHSASKIVTEPRTLMVDRDCSSTTGSAAIPVVQKKRIWRTELIRKDFYSLNTPDMILDEIVGLAGYLPSYDLQRCYSITDSMFQCRVRFNDYVGYGYGTSVKDAKNGAASSLLDKLIRYMYFGNTIGRLQEFCTAQGWPLPIYGDEMDEYLENEHGFIVSCTVRKHREFGHGKSKRMAKTFAAYKMWLKLTTTK